LSFQFPRMQQKIGDEEGIRTFVVFFQIEMTKEQKHQMLVTNL